MNTRTETQLEFDFMNSSQLKLDFDKNIYFGTSNASQLITFTPTKKIIFTNESGTVGVLNWSDGTMRFEGEADESAQLFFDHIIKQYLQMLLPLGGWKS